MTKRKTHGTCETEEDYDEDKGEKQSKRCWRENRKQNVMHYSLDSERVSSCVCACVEIKGRKSDCEMMVKVEIFRCDNKIVVPYVCMSLLR